MSNEEMKKYEEIFEASAIKNDKKFGDLISNLPNDDQDINNEYGNK